MRASWCSLDPAVLALHGGLHAVLGKLQESCQHRVLLGVLQLHGAVLHALHCCFLQASRLLPPLSLHALLQLGRQQHVLSVAVLSPQSWKSS